MIIKYLKSRWIMFLIVLFFFLIRLPFLDKTFLLYDERDTALTQYSLAKTGKDLYGNKLPSRFERISPHAPVLAMYYGVPFWKLGLPQTVTTVRFIYLLPSSLLPLLVFELLYALLKKRNLAILTGLVFSFSPWVFHVSRLALEINLAFPLFLIALLLQVKKKHVWSFVFFALAFLTYQGIRPLIFLAFIYSEIWMLYQRKKIHNFLANMSVFTIMFLVLIVISTLIEGNITKRGSSEVVFFATERLKNEVDYSRSFGKYIPVISPLIDNKIIYIADHLIGNAFQGLNLTYLFKTGDQVPIYSNAITGQFYSFLSIFLLIGLFQLGRKNLKEYYFVAGFSLIGIVSSIINIYSISFSIRSMFSGVGLGFIISLGLTESYKIIIDRQKILKYPLLCISAFIIVFQLSGFLYQYTVKRPILQSELFNENERKLSSFLLTNNKSYTVHTTSPFTYFLSYVFLRQPAINELHEIQDALKKAEINFKFNNLSFAQCSRGTVEFSQIPQNTVVESACLSDKSNSLLKSSNKSQYDTIQFSDIDPLRDPNEVKFYIFK